MHVKFRVWYHCGRSHFQWASYLRHGSQSYSRKCWCSIAHKSTMLLTPLRWGTQQRKQETAKLFLPCKTWLETNTRLICFGPRQHDHLHWSAKMKPCARTVHMNRAHPCCNSQGSLLSHSWESSIRMWQYQLHKWDLLASVMSFRKLLVHGVHWRLFERSSGCETSGSSLIVAGECRRLTWKVNVASSKSRSLSLFLQPLHSGRRSQVCETRRQKG